MLPCVALRPNGLLPTFAPGPRWLIGNMPAAAERLTAFDARRLRYRCGVARAVLRVVTTRPSPMTSSLNAHDTSRLRALPPQGSGLTTPNPSLS